MNKSRRVTTRVGARVCTCVARETWSSLVVEPRSLGQVYETRESHSSWAELVAHSLWVVDRVHSRSLGCRIPHQRGSPDPNAQPENSSSSPTS